MIVESYEDIVILSGSLNANYWETMHTAISLTLKRHQSGVIIDCSGLTHATPEGAETFHDAMAFINQHEHARILVAAVPEQVMAVLREVPDVRSQLAVASSVEEARASLDFLEAERQGRKPKSVLKRWDTYILACLCPNVFDEHVMLVTKELVSTITAKVVVLIPIVVPRELPIQAPMPEIEKRARTFAECVEDLLSNANVSHEIRLERSRDFVGLVHELSEEINANHVILGLPNTGDSGPADLKMVSSVLEKVSRPLMLVRGTKTTS
ncbi:MAG: hypothetical protein MUC92_04855 [Fimbriimonadaceae bacterium]|jgi:anti-anti-sigma regulatory factor|nr:hypothetical protein [Fimbriimonadaceae bacterium]